MRIAQLLLITVLCGCAALAQQQSPEALFNSAQQKQHAGDYESAITQYKHLVTLHPEITAAHASLAVCLATVGRYNEAIEEYKTALKQAPGNHDLRLDLALAYYKGGKIEDAAKEFRSLFNDSPSDARVLTLMSDCYLRLHKDAELIPLLLPVEQSNANDPAIEWALGSAMIHTGQNREGLQRVEKVLQERPVPEAYALAGEAHLRLEEFAAARENIDKAMRLNPNLPGIHTLDGMVKEYGNDLQGAETAYREAIAANPSDFQPHLRRGAVLYELRNLDEAQKELQRALELDPSSAYARFELAKVEKGKGQLDLAAKDFEKVAEQVPQWLPPHVELGALYYRLKRPQDGAREKEIVDRLTAEEQQRKAKLKVISPQLPSQ